MCVFGGGGGSSYKTAFYLVVKRGSIFCLSFYAPETPKEMAKFRKFLKSGELTIGRRPKDYSKGL